LMCRESLNLNICHFWLQKSAGRRMLSAIQRHIAEVVRIVRGERM
jgi:hypothetical protein